MTSRFKWSRLNEAGLNEASFNGAGLNEVSFNGAGLNEVRLIEVCLIDVNITTIFCANFSKNIVVNLLTSDVKQCYNTFCPQDIADLCNGSTTDSGSVCQGSNPWSAAKKPRWFFHLGFFFYLKSHH